MFHSKELAENQITPANNKPELEHIQDLLKSTNLLISAQKFIAHFSRKASKSIHKSGFKLLLRAVYLSTWLRHVTMTFSILSNKNMTYFLIPITLSLAHSSSYLIATSGKQILLLILSILIWRKHERHYLLSQTSRQ